MTELLTNTHPALRPFWHPVALEYRRMLIELVATAGTATAPAPPSRRPGRRPRRRRTMTQAVAAVVVPPGEAGR